LSIPGAVGYPAALPPKRPPFRRADGTVVPPVGCGQNVYVCGGKVIQIEGDPDSPVSRGRLCPKGSASLQLTTGSARQYQVKYRRPFGKDWEDLDLDAAMDMIADRVLHARRSGWQWDVDGIPARRTLGVATLGGATLDNEENYLIKKLFSDTKSQKLSWAVWAWGNPRSGSCLAAWTRSGNLMASWMKKTGMLFPTRSQCPAGYRT
jgi:anaerobic selenocysteine-containing dehydrogenase